MGYGRQFATRLLVGVPITGAAVVGALTVQGEYAGHESESSPWTRLAFIALWVLVGVFGIYGILGIVLGIRHATFVRRFPEAVIYDSMKSPHLIPWTSIREIFPTHLHLERTGADAIGLVVAHADATIELALVFLGGVSGVVPAKRPRVDAIRLDLESRLAASEAERRGAVVQ